ncbi:MAG: tRNA (N(6)-L-threonylcarbamoyladenosine(37)-C(2))-methylthiotransferase MtaB [Sedimentisphaerales bacterium]|nr:tRNA (N(6)-L-threonylcarbamoyladenosine(37)-C(2))-methylthiotransferase MtaB [Sedimentisphaerales bacterium]
MKTFSINTFGCKVNQYESQQIRQFLERLGLNQIETSQRPDLVVINTCCVTHIASAKSRQYVRKTQQQSPGAVIVVCGCLPIVQNNGLTGLGGNICFISHRNELADKLNEIAAGKKTFPDFQSLQTCQNIIKAKNEYSIKRIENLAQYAELPNLTAFKGHTRAFLKIQDGCDGNCSYCIVPQTRPYVHSKSAEAILQEAQALVAAGHKEIVVTGVFLGAFGQETVRRKNWQSKQNDKLPDLLDKLTQIPGLSRIRLSSLEPADVTPRLLDTFCKHRNIMPHLHLSLQSGSNETLKKMCRQYNADDFRDKVSLIKSQLDRPAISTDIIVGFPTETDDDFEQTVSLAKEVGFAKMHVFAFSPRKSTAAANMQGTVNSKVIKIRSRILRELDKQLQCNYRQQFIGETAEVLLENSTSRLQGRAERYFYVYLDKSSDRVRANDLVSVKLLKNEQNGILGELTG